MFTYSYSSLSMWCHMRDYRKGVCSPRCSLPSHSGYFEAVIFTIDQHSKRSTKNIDMLFHVEGAGAGVPPIPFNSCLILLLSATTMDHVHTGSSKRGKGSLNADPHLPRHLRLLTSPATAATSFVRSIQRLYLDGHQEFYSHALHVMGL